MQLRQDNLAGDHFSLVGFQTQIKWGDQARVLRMIPGLEAAEFVRFGMVHRNTYVNGPTVLAETWQVRARPSLFFAGQMSGVEGYVESAASGLLAGLNAAALAKGEPVVVAAAHDRDRRAGLLRVARRTRRTTSRRTSRSGSCEPLGRRRAARAAQAGDVGTRAGELDAGMAECALAAIWTTCSGPHDRTSQGVPAVSRAQSQRVGAHGARLRQRSLAVPRACGRGAGAARCAISRRRSSIVWRSAASSPSCTRRALSRATAARKLAAVADVPPLPAPRRR